MTNRIRDIEAKWTHNASAKLDALNFRQHLRGIRRQLLIQPASNPESLYGVDRRLIGLGAIGLQNKPPAESQPIGAVEFARFFIIALRLHALELAPYLTVPILPDNVQMLAARRGQFEGEINRAFPG